MVLHHTMYFKPFWIHLTHPPSYIVLTFMKSPIPNHNGSKNSPWALVKFFHSNNGSKKICENKYRFCIMLLNLSIWIYLLPTKYLTTSNNFLGNFHAMKIWYKYHNGNTNLGSSWNSRPLSIQRVTCRKKRYNDETFPLQYFCLSSCVNFFVQYNKPSWGNQLNINSSFNSYCWTSSGDTTISTSCKPSIILEFGAYLIYE